MNKSVAVQKKNTRQLKAIARESLIANSMKFNIIRESKNKTSMDHNLSNKINKEMKMLYVSEQSDSSLQHAKHINLGAAMLEKKAIIKKSLLNDAELTTKKELDYHFDTDITKNKLINEIKVNLSSGPQNVHVHGFKKNDDLNLSVTVDKHVKI